ncbi:hypothetical protein GCM10022254_35510 [Actinomadura meridiana]|uniref:Uncharacterized protein n=2 Tax=Actinomadura meridiana TaxID=559626 RepID=A0ABP8C485_9ACTN
MTGRFRPSPTCKRTDRPQKYFPTPGACPELDDRTGIKQTEYAAFLPNRLPDAAEPRLVEDTMAAAETERSEQKYVQSFAFATGLVDTAPGQGGSASE